MESKRKERPQQVSSYRTGLRLLGGLDLRSNKKGMSLFSAYLMHWEEWPLSSACWLWVWGTSRSGGKEVRKGWSVESSAHMSTVEKRLMLVLCGSTRDKTWGLGLGKQKQKKV